jgi:signal transduction histidine kinase
MLQKEEVYILIVVGSSLFLLVAFFLVLFVLYFFKKKKQILLEKELLKKTFNENLLQSQLEIQEQTLQHISHELHDNLGQVASLIKINLNTLQLNEPVKAAEKIETTKDITRQLITDLKLLSVRLGSDRITRTGLTKALETEVERLNKTGQFSATLTQEGNTPGIDNDKAIILYRMAQEILNNMVKHSGAKHIGVLLNSSKNLFTLAFTDDGVGFNIEAKMNSGGAGLFNLQNRARLINAQLIIQSTPHNGTTIRIELPI